jgi:phosphonate degradation associated HDIG domain protein
MTNKNAISAVLQLFHARGDAEYHGEAVSQSEHAIQAALLALEETGDRELAAAALLHDIGHLLADPEDADMDGYGALKHEALGAQFLRKLGFLETVAQLVGGHVAAKRYLTWADQHYYDQLSEASKETLRFQGGRMSAEEAARFERDPLFEKHILLRRIDERAKIPNVTLPDVETFQSLLEAVHRPPAPDSSLHLL